MFAAANAKADDADEWSGQQVVGPAHACDHRLGASATFTQNTDTARTQSFFYVEACAFKFNLHTAMIPPSTTRAGDMDASAEEVIAHCMNLLRQAIQYRGWYRDFIHWHTNPRFELTIHDFYRAVRRQETVRVHIHPTTKPQYADETPPQLTDVTVTGRTLIVRADRPVRLALFSWPAGLGLGELRPANRHHRVEIVLRRNKLKTEHILDLDRSTADMEGRALYIGAITEERQSILVGPYTE